MSKLFTSVLIHAYKNNINPTNNRPWFQLLSTTILTAYIYAFFEWIFYITQPSYAAITTNAIIKLNVLFFSGLIIASIFGILIIAIFLIYLLIPIKIISSLLLIVGRFIFSFLLSCLLLLLIDNFTYTLFNIGIVSSTGFWRVVYTVLFIILIFLNYRWSASLVSSIHPAEYRKNRWRFIASFGLLITSLISAFTTYLKDQPTVNPAKERVSAQSDFPNILIIGSDGVNADNLSVYGYDRETTPFLAAFTKGALIAQNAFHNATTSDGSVTSMLTGKLPTTTRVLYPPDILVGEDALEHLPGLLKAEGYRTVEIALPHYVDAFTVNFQKGFDIVNDRSAENYPILYMGWEIGGDYPVYFISMTVERITTRLKHILFIKKMGNPYQEVTTGSGIMMTDQERIDQAISLINNQDTLAPIFIHLHLLGTHGPNYYPSENYFTASIVQNETNSTNFYDGAIRDFDNYFREIILSLKESGKLENTIVVVYSDHGRDRTKNRVPWIIRFPNQDYSGEISANVQNLDIAPTLLDYLDLQIPNWMEGQSVINHLVSNDRRIYITDVNPLLLTTNSMWIEVKPELFQPPFFHFDNLRLIVCNQYYEVNLTNNKWTEGLIEGHTTPCDPASLPTLTEARQEIIEHLASRGFDVSTLQK